MRPATYDIHVMRLAGTGRITYWNVHEVEFGVGPYRTKAAAARAAARRSTPAEVTRQNAAERHAGDDEEAL